MRADLQMETLSVPTQLGDVITATNGAAGSWPLLVIVGAVTISSVLHSTVGGASTLGVSAATITQSNPSCTWSG